MAPTALAEPPAPIGDPAESVTVKPLRFQSLSEDLTFSYPSKAQLLLRGAGLAAILALLWVPIVAGLAVAGLI